ncbi:MAG: hypothetical protein HY774_08075 [Acidobacteria bacterium]|nr:hypothetical protein [Acidobacteriota bacterium]
MITNSFSILHSSFSGYFPKKKRADPKQHPDHRFPVAVFSLPLASRKMYTFEWIEDPINRGETEEQSKSIEFGYKQIHTNLQ